MKPGARRRFSRLLRWYPRAWRDEHGAFLLDLLEDEAARQGRTRPTVAEGWSVRAHGLAIRATPTATLAVALSALAAAFVPALVLYGPHWLGATTWVAPVMTLFVAPFLMLVAALMLFVRWSGSLAPPAALASIVFWCLHSAAATTTAISFSAGWQEKNISSAEVDHTTWFGNSYAVWFLLAGAFGVAALSIPIDALVWRIRDRAALWATAALSATLVLMGLFVASLTPSIGPLLAGALVTLATIEVHRASDARGTARRSGFAWSRRRATPGHRVLVVLLLAGVTSAAAGGLAMLTAFGTPAWSAAPAGSTQAINIGLALGCLAALPAAAAATLAVYRAFGMRWLIGGSMLLLALMLEAASQFAGAGHSLQEPLWLGAAVAIGAAIAIPLTTFIRLPQPLGTVVTVAGTLLCALVVGLGVPFLPAVAPLGALAMAVWAAVRLARIRRAA